MLAFYLQMIDTDEEKSKFETVYREYKKLLYNIAYSILKDRQLAEDAVQDAYLSLTRNMKKFENQSCIQMRNYLIIIIRNVSFRIYSRNKREISGEKLFDGLADPMDIEQETEDRDSRARLLKLVERLDKKYSDVLVLRYFYGLRNKEIAAALKISLDNVKIRLHRGKSELKKLLGEGRENE